MTSVVSKIVEVCVFRFSEDRVEYLMLKRADDDVLYPGIWQMVTGSVREGEKAIEAAFREFHEETGLAALRSWIAPHLSIFYEAKHDAVHVCPFFAVQVESGIDPVLSPEHQEFQWLPFADAQRLLVWPGQREGLDLVDRYIVTGEEAAGLSRI